MWWCVVGVALAGGSAEDAVLVVDPASPDALAVANHYRAVRGIPDRNVIYVDPVASNYGELVDGQLQVFQAELITRGIHHVDYVVLAPADSFYVPLAVPVRHFCAPVTRMSLSAAWSSSDVAATIRAGGQTELMSNQYAGAGFTPEAFDSATTWQGGMAWSSGARYHLAASLGWTGDNGNSVSEILDMIDRSAAVDGTLPQGTFYFEETSDPARTGPRVGGFAAAVARITAAGGQAHHELGVLPLLRYDALGIMSGFADAGILTEPYGLLDGAFADHLTSYAATFDTTSQSKVSAWITAGASGSWGTVEEPCNWSAKFPSPQLHPMYFDGLSLGEAAFRSVTAFPFQGLLYGDPLTRPFSHLPEISLTMPPGPLSGRLTLNPVATTSHPTARIDTLELMVDGEPAGLIQAPGTLPLRTTRYADGPHELRIRATDDASTRDVGVWREVVWFDNHPSGVDAWVPQTHGDTSTLFEVEVLPLGAGLVQATLVANGRVVAAVHDAADPLRVYGATVGVGTVDLQVRAQLTDGTEAWSDLTPIEVSPAAPTAGQPPVVSDLSIRLPTSRPSLLWFPAGGDDPASPHTVQILGGAVGLTVDGREGWRILRPNGLTPADALTWTAANVHGGSAPATLSITWDPCADGMAVEVPPIVPGSMVTVTITCAWPHEPIALAGSRSTGETWAPALALRSSLAAPRVLASGTTDAQGAAQLSFTAPAGMVPGRTVYLQAAQIGRAGPMSSAIVR